LLLFCQYSIDISTLSAIWALNFLGRLHPLMVHFPVSLLVLAWVLHFFTKLKETIKVLVIIGSITAIISVILGLLLAWQEGMEGETLDWHRFSGIGLGAISLALLYLVNSKNLEGRLFKWVLTLGLLLTTLTGHLGASLTHGETYLTELLPWNASNESLANLADFGEVLTPEEEVKLVGNVRAIFAHNCYKCHGEVKQKGELRLDEKEYIFGGGENGKIIEAGNAEKSELFRRINLAANHKDVMPSKGKKLQQSEIDLIGFWINKGAPWPENMGEVNIFPMAELAPKNPSLPAGKFENPIDLWVNDYFTKNKMNWKPKVSDKLFLRRVYLDIVGLTPTFEAIQEFEKDKNPKKREAIINELLSRNDAYTQHWLTFWNDALRNDYTGTGYITKGRFNITNWLYTSLEQNTPYDKMVKELLNPNEESKGFIEGIKWRGTVNASQRTEMQAAQNVGQVLLGLNLKCASCHDSFVSNWKLEDAYAFANVFAEEQLEIARCEKPTGKFAKTRILWPSLGQIDSSANRGEKLNQLAERIVQPANGRLYRTVVNRYWANLMGRGLIAAVDEMDNKPWSQDLLDWLAFNFQENGSDLKKLIYLIATSDAYQMESEAIKDPVLLAKDSYKFNGMIRRRLTAEQFSDAVSSIISPIFNADEKKYEPLLEAGFMPTGNYVTRASLVANNAFLTAMGRPNREVVATSRPAEASLLQALELTNGVRLDSTLKKGAAKWKKEVKSTEGLVTKIYREALGREPNQQELKVAVLNLGESPSVEQIQDLFWAVVILPEFQLIY
jgi:mono/diheme cytochrome c family protein